MAEDYRCLLEPTEEIFEARSRPRLLVPAQALVNTDDSPALLEALELGQAAPPLRMPAILPDDKCYFVTFDGGEVSLRLVEHLQHSALNEFATFFERLKYLSNLRPNWNTYGAQMPNSTALKAARDVLEHASELGMPPRSVNASAENGIVLSFARADRYADIECFNSGEILAATHDRIGESDPDIWTIQDESEIKEALEHLRDFVNAGHH